MNDGRRAGLNEASIHCILRVILILAGLLIVQTGIGCEHMTSVADNVSKGDAIIVALNTDLVEASCSVVDARCLIIGRCRSATDKDGVVLDVVFHEVDNRERVFGTACALFVVDLCPGRQACPASGVSLSTRW